MRGWELYLCGHDTTIYLQPYLLPLLITHWYHRIALKYLHSDINNLRSTPFTLNVWNSNGKFRLEQSVSWPHLQLRNSIPSHHSRSTRHPLSQPREIWYRILNRRTSKHPIVYIKNKALRLQQSTYSGIESHKLEASAFNFNQRRELAIGVRFIWLGSRSLFVKPSRALPFASATTPDETCCAAFAASYFAFCLNRDNVNNDTC